MRKPTAKKVILGVLLARKNRALTVQVAIRAGRIFELTENNIRVTLARLSSEGLIESAQRGSYRLGPASEELADQVARWQSAESRLVPWQGKYFAVHCGHLGRSDRKALKLRERAFKFLGFRQLESGFYIRPNNLSGGVTDIRKRLKVFGLEPEANVFVAEDLDTARQNQLTALWDVEQLEEGYRGHQSRMHRWLERYEELEYDDAARESYLLGGQAIRMLVFDPWLPDQMIDSALRHEFVQSVYQFNEVGRAIWAQLALSDLPPNPPVSIDMKVGKAPNGATLQ